MKKVITREDGSKKVVSVNDGPSKTDTQFAEECDVNNIMKKFHATGQISHMAKRQGTWADVSGVRDLSESMQLINEAKDQFMRLPAKTRLRFNNDIREFMEFMNDPNMLEESVELGLREVIKDSSLDADKRHKAGPSEKTAGNKAKGRVSKESDDGDGGGSSKVSKADS